MTLTYLEVSPNTDIQILKRALKVSSLCLEATNGAAENLVA